MNQASIDACVDLGIWLLWFTTGTLFGVWWARASWVRGWRAAQSNYAEVEQLTLDRMPVESANQYVRAKRGVPRQQWKA